MSTSKTVMKWLNDSCPLMRPTYFIEPVKEHEDPAIEALREFEENLFKSAMSTVGCKAESKSTTGVFNGICVTLVEVFTSVDGVNVLE